MLQKMPLFSHEPFTMLVQMRVLIICVGLIGVAACSQAGDSRQDTFTPLTNGFGYVTHVSNGAERSLTQGLWYQNAAGKKTWVWPYLQMVWGQNLQISSNVVLLIGGVSEPIARGGDLLRDHLIAFRAPSGPPMDITDDIFRIFCTNTGVSFTNIQRDNGFVGLIETNDSVQIDISFWRKHEGAPTWSDSTNAIFTISWGDIDRVLEDVKKNGKMRKEKRSGIEYLKNE
jgi:hypothetical protein